MKDEIKETKEQVLQRMRKSIDERGIDRVDVAELGMLADVVKDLAEADEACWESLYYQSVTSAMDGQRGYDGGMDGQRGYDGGMGYAWPERAVVRRGMGYDGPERDGIARVSASRGYRDYPYGHDDTMGELRQMMQMADPQERERLRMQLRQMADM